eukprot:scaffold5580_cov59-Phaeocystis_antarctica.AAC.3
MGKQPACSTQGGVWRREGERACVRRKLTAAPARSEPGWLAVPCKSSDEAKITCTRSREM